MSRFVLRTMVVGLIVMALGAVTPAFAQEATGDLLLYTEFPSQVIGLDESLTMNFEVSTTTTPQLVSLSVPDLPEGWTASFRSSNRVVEAVFVTPDNPAKVDLRVEAAPDSADQTVSFNVLASSQSASSEMPVELTVQERVPANLEFEVDLPTLRGKPDSTFRYNLTLKNEGDEDLTVDLLAQAPSFFGVTFKSGSNELSSLPIAASGSESLNVEVAPLRSAIPADSYPITVTAQGGAAAASVDLMAEVVGQSTIDVTTPDGRLSGRAEAGQETSYALLVKNTGTAPARNIEMNASEPNGWTVAFDPATIESIAPGDAAEVTANVTPAEKALAGDYAVTFKASPDEGADVSVDYRVTVRTSTIWGVVGIGLIAVAVVVVGLAVMRFGRR